MEGKHEVDGLRYWNGDPTVRLLNADENLGAMLLEHCDPGTALRTIPEPEQDHVIAKPSCSRITSPAVRRRRNFRLFLLQRGQRIHT